jgi:heme exporter protein C
VRRNWPLYLVTIGGALALAAIFGTFFVAPITVIPDTEPPILNFAQKIFYFHVPVALTSFIMFAVTAVAGLLVLVKKDKKYDTLGHISAEVAVLYAVLTMITGVLWTRAEWGVWWTWEPRLTTYFILLLLMGGYFMLRSSVEDPNRRARFSAVYGIVAFLDVPISFLSIRLIQSVHPVVFSSKGAAMETNMLVTFLIGMAAMVSFGIGLLVIRFREEVAKEELEYLKNQIGS